jgi:hypothetical protein
MSFATSSQAHDPLGPRGLALALLRAFFAICITAFMVGGPAVSSLETSTSELSRQDGASVGNAGASPWLRRTASAGECEFGGVPYGLSNDDFVLPEPPVEDIAIQRPVELVVALVTESRHAAPVRGPPCARA